MTRRGKKSMSQIHIRSLHPTDLEPISSIENLITGHPRRDFLEKRFRAVAANPDHFISCVAMDQGILQGYALAQVQEGEFGTTEAQAVLDVIGVHPVAQGHGVGQALLGGIQADLQRRGVGILKTQIAWTDRKMVHFFSSAGFSLAPFQIIGRDTSPLEERVAQADSGIEAHPRREQAQFIDDFQDLSRDRVLVRSLQAEDLAEVVRIDHSLTGRDRTAYFSAKFRELLTESGIRVSLVSEEDGVLTGFVMARVDFGEFGKVDRTSVIDSIGVHPAFKGSGIGHALLSQLLLNLSTLQVETVLTQVSAEDFNLHRFLHACGFVQSQRLVLWKSFSGEQSADSRESRSSQVEVLS
jgi:N-acetylglutamate synthase-like GNAT family acetyltransferase